MSPSTAEGASKGRDSRVDVLRGLALLTIFVNHVPGTLYEGWTWRNFGFSDAAEVFVMLAGFAAAYAYLAKFVPGKFFLTTVRAGRRAGVLYLVHVATSVIAIAVFAAGALALDRPDLLVPHGLKEFFADAPEGMIGLATLGHQLGYFNILPMYSATLLALPLMLVLARLDLRLMLGLSVALWLAAGLTGLNLPRYPQEGGWFFNPFSWQLLFAIGLYCGARVREGATPFPFHPVPYILALAWLAFALIFVRQGWWGSEGAIPGRPQLVHFDKTFISLPRLLHVLAAAYVFARTPFLLRLVDLKPTNPLALVGRHALPIYASGSVLAMMLIVVKSETGWNVALDGLMLAAGVAFHLALAVWLETVRLNGKAASRASADKAPLLEAVAR